MYNYKDVVFIQFYTGQAVDSAVGTIKYRFDGANEPSAAGVVFDDSRRSGDIDFNTLNFEIGIANQVDLFDVNIELNRICFSNIYFGEVFSLESGIFSGFSPPDLNKRTSFRTSLSSEGEFIGRSVYRRGASFTVTIRNVKSRLVRSERFTNFLAHAESKPFYFMWDIENRPSDIEYCWLQDNPTITITSRGLMQVEMRMRSFKA